MKEQKLIPETLLINGFAKTSKVLKEKETLNYNFNFETIEKVREQIRIHLVKDARFHHRANSYSLKHDFEDIMGEYVSNGELIYAMIMEGYSYKQVPLEDINCRFNVSAKNLKKLKEFRKINGLN